MAYTIVTTMPPTSAQTQQTEIEINVVMDDNQIPRSHSEGFDGRSYTGTAKVHKGLRQKNRDLLPFYTANPVDSLMSLFAQGDPS